MRFSLKEQLNVLRKFKLNFLQKRGGSLIVNNSIIGKNVYLNKAIISGNNVIGTESTFSGRVIIGRWTTIGRHNIFSAGPTEITIGNYCQTGPYVSIYASFHPMNKLTTYQNGRFLNGVIKEFGPSDPIKIGSDVWIGHGSILLKGVTVGNGAIIGSGAVVTHDVPDFGIVVGNPARVIRKRYAEDVIAAISDLEWWSYDEEALKAVEFVFKLDSFNDGIKTIKALESAKGILAAFEKIK